MSPEWRAAAEILMGLLKWPWSKWLLSLDFPFLPLAERKEIEYSQQNTGEQNHPNFQFPVKQGAWTPPCVLQVMSEILALSRSWRWTLFSELSLNSVVDY